VIGLARGSLTSPDPAGQVLGDRERRALNEIAGERLFRLSTEAAREGALLVAERMRETEGELLLGCALESDDSTPLLPALEFEALRRKLGAPAPDATPVRDAPAWRRGRSEAKVALLQDIERARALFLGRDPAARRGSGGRHDGAFDAARARALADPGTTGRLSRWSATQLESWRQCPHQFFQRYVLGLRPPDERPVEAEANAVGTLVHRALHLLYDAGVGADPPDRGAIESALATAESAVEPALRGDPAVWAVTRRRTAAELESYFKHVHAKTRPTAFEPVAFELGFGLEEDGPAGIPIETPRGSITLRGRLDRLDREASSGALHVLDYKHSKKRRSHQEAVDEEVCGVDRFQLYAYFLAAESWAEREGWGPPSRLTGAIHCIREPRILGPLVAPDVDRIRARVSAAIEEALAGRYDPSPRDRDACGYCDFRRSCRIALVAAGDIVAGEPEEDA
jgi:RecB family exonuclease